MKFRTFMDSKVLTIDEYISPSSSDIEMASASYTGNKTITWAKFILTDSKPNGNYQRIPESEFSSLITSGVNMPFKMAAGRVNEGHEDALPLGVITNLVQEDDTVVALAAMWGEERPADISLLKEMMADDGAMVSWELFYSASSFNDETGVETLYGTTLKAATIVGRPAYEGRTPVIALSAKRKSGKWSKKYIDSLPDTSFLITGIRDGSGDVVRLYPFADVDGIVNVSRLKKSMNELSDSNLPMGVIRGAISKARRLQETINDASASIGNNLEDRTLKTVEELMKDVEILEAKVSDLEKELETKASSASNAEAELANATDELESLRAFKQEIEDMEAKQERLASITALFSEAGIEKDDEYFAENSELLLGLEQPALEFMIQELASFASQAPVTNDDENVAASKIPNVLARNDGKIDIDSLADALRNNK